MLLAVGAMEVKKPIVLYDDSCRFCVAQIKILKNIDFCGQLNFDSLYKYPHLSQDSLCLLSPNKKTYVGAHAFKYMARELILLWPLWAVMSIPYSMRLWEILYVWVAKNRYKIYGKCNSACGFNKSKS